MARIAGVDIPPQKRVVISLTYITGIGNTTAQKLVKTAGVNPDTRVKDLSDEEVTRLRQIIDKMAGAKELLIEGDLRRDVANNIKRLTEIGSYRRMRHPPRLPPRRPRPPTHPPRRRRPQRAGA